MKVIIPGGSGQVGHIIARHFHDMGDNVTVLSRSPRREPWRVVQWDGVTRGAWVSELELSDVCINLAGRSVNCRYTPRNRRAIRDSRVRSTLLLHQVFTSLKHPPRLWINASTATIYRHALDRPMDEANGELGGNEPGAPETWNYLSKLPKHGKKPSSRPQRRALARSPFAAPLSWVLTEVESSISSWLWSAAA